MTEQPDPPLDDRVHDQNLDRLRDAAAHFIDIVRTVVRVQLDAGGHPFDAVIQGTHMLENWESAMYPSGPLPPGAYTSHVEAVLARLHARVGAQRMWEWVRLPNEQLHGRTPLRALVGHDVRAVAALIDAMPAPPAPGVPS
jgi:hypothetical protein